jgi:hypothetical protein
MAYNFEFAARLVRLRAALLAGLVFAFAACDNTEQPLSPSSDTPADPGVETVTIEEPSFASVSFAGGIPIGHFGQPVSAYGNVNNGAKMTVSPGGLLDYLAGVKARGGKVVLMFAGPHTYYKDGDGHFSMTKWKARIVRFRNVNFSSYITSGTVIGHFLVDEPNDASDWGGRMITPSQLDEMARYSKSRWSNMATIVRVEPYYLVKSPPRYLDAAWAQYVTRKGTASDYISRHVTDAKRAGVALVVGLNISKGGPNRTRMTPTMVRNFGSTLLSSSYPCAFISWEYGSYLTTSSMTDALKYLRSKAQNRSTKTCRG